MKYETPTLTYLGNLADEPVRIVDVEAEQSGLRLEIWRRPTLQCDAKVSNVVGRTLYQSVFAPDAERAIEGAVAFVRHALRAPIAAAALAVNARAELRN